MAKIVLIDDDETIAEAVSVALETQSHTVRCVTDPSRALSVIKRMQPDLLFVDLFMTGQSGNIFIQELKKAKIVGDAPIILFSAHPNVASLSKEAGADGFLAKPFDIETLFTCVAQHLAH